MAIKKFLNQNLSPELKLLLHFDGNDGDTSTTDSSPSQHSITFNGDAQLDTANKKWGTASLLLDGAGDSIQMASSADWNVFSDNTENWTIDFQLKLIGSGLQYFITQREDSNNRWYIFYYDSGANTGIKFVVKSGGTNIIESAYSGAAINSDWHHIAFCKVGSLYGVYFDGTQILYVSDSSSDTLINAPLYVGEQGDSNWFLNGQIDELRIINSNAFNASPNSGKTDTITPPSGAYSGGVVSKIQTADLADIAKIIGITK